MGGRGASTKLGKVPGGGGWGSVGGLPGGAGGGSGPGGISPGSGGGVTGGAGAAGGAAGAGPMSGNPGQGAGGAGLPGAGTAQKTQTRFERPQGALDANYRKKLEARFDRGTDDAKRVYDKYIPDASHCSDLNESGKYYPNNPTLYGAKANTIVVEQGEDIRDTSVHRACATWYHENGHYIDHNSGGQSYSYSFTQAIQNDLTNFELDTLRRSPIVVGALQSSGLSQSIVSAILNSDSIRGQLVVRHIMTEDQLDDIVCARIRSGVVSQGSRKMVGITDLFSSVSEGYNTRIKAFGSYHRWIGYYRDYRQLRYQEAWANMYRSEFYGDEIALWDQYFPTAHAVFQAQLGGL